MSATWEFSQRGWYPDPEGGPGYRYWDGRAWTRSIPEGPKPVGTALSGAPMARAGALVLNLFMLLLWVVVFAASGFNWLTILPVFVIVLIVFAAARDIGERRQPLMSDADRLRDKARISLWSGVGFLEMGLLFVAAPMDRFGALVGVIWLVVAGRELLFWWRKRSSD